jgi:hypothetical protein
VIVQIPTVRTDTVFPETVQTDGVVDAKLTGRLDEAVALTVNGDAPQVWSGRAAKVIAWTDPEDVTVKLRGSS